MLTSRACAAALCLALMTTSAVGQEKRACDPAFVAAEAGDHALAIERIGACIDAEQALEARKSLLFSRGIMHAQLGDLPTAVEDFGAAIRLDPDWAKAYYYRGHAFMHLGIFADAAKDFTEVLRISPDDADAVFMRGAAAYELGAYEQAVADYTAALRLNPEDRNAYFLRSKAYEALGQHDRAAEDLKASGRDE